MVECCDAKSLLKDSIKNKYENELDINSFCNMLRSPSMSYKFYWLEAIVYLAVEKKKTKLTIDEIIDEMIINAWSSVTKFKLKLAPKKLGNTVDGIENIINCLNEDASAKIEYNIKKKKIVNSIKVNSGKIKAFKENIYKNVPFRALSAFFTKQNLKPQYNRPREVIEHIEKNDKNKELFPYAFGNENGLDTKIFINPVWQEMFRDNYKIILCWIKYEKAKWLQKNNPSVPAIINKIEEEKTRQSLDSIRKLWDLVIKKNNNELKEIYRNNNLTQEYKYDIDHFIPWSYTGDNELWNLVPADHKANIQKGNQVPNFDNYICKVIALQWKLYQSIHRDTAIFKQFSQCTKNHLCAQWAYDLFNKEGVKKSEFEGQIKENLKTLHDAALRQGFRQWNEEA